MLSKAPSASQFAAQNPENSGSFFVTKLILYKSIMSFPNGSAADPDKVIPQIFKDFVSKPNGSAGLNFLKSLTKLITSLEIAKYPKP